MIYNESKYNKDWNENKLSDLGVFSRGKSKHRPRNDERLFAGGKYPFIQTGDIKEANLYIKNHIQEYGEFGLKQSKLWNKGTLCITIAANIAETAILSYPACFPDSVVGFNAYESQSSEIFMYYIFEYIKASIQNAASGSIQDNINIDYLTTLNFKIPKKNYQDMIVALLGAIDKKIISNNDINDNLLAMAYDIYMYSFYGKIPNGKLNDILVEADKSSVQVGEAKQSTGEYPFFTSGSAILKWDTPFINGRNCFLNTGGNADVKFYVGEAAYSTDTWCISANKNMSDYLYLLLVSIKPELNQKFFQGTGLKHLQKLLLKYRPIYIPDSNELQAFNEQANPIFNVISENTRENQELITLRDWLLPMLMNGQATIIE
ncbi:MAG: restriction endonuclease subunit S [Clostridiales bacterium]|nr:restriction endonuclease subunit S [Clostridiales bacterium]